MKLKTDGRPISLCHRYLGDLRGNCKCKPGRFDAEVEDGVNKMQGFSDDNILAARLKPSVSVLILRMRRLGGHYSLH